MNLTVTQFINKVWLPTLDVTAGTAQDYEYSLNGSILPKFGNKPMKDIKPHDIESWVVELKTTGKLSDRTIEKRRNLLAQILKKAVQNEYLDKTPFAKLTFSKAKTVNKVVPLTYDQVKNLANSLTARFRIMIWIGYYTGMRPSEILGVTWEQLDFENETIVIDRQISRNLKEMHAPQGLKTDNSERTIGFSKDLQILIKEHVDTFGYGPDGLIMQTNSGKVFRYKGAIEMFRVAARAAGLKVGEGLHQLRHTCVSVLIAEGANPKEIQEWVGHASIEETMDTYGHLFPNAKHQLSSMLDRHAKKHSEIVPLEVAN
jgi:integrase